MRFGWLVALLGTALAGCRGVPPALVDLSLTLASDCDPRSTPSCGRGRSAQGVVFRAEAPMAFAETLTPGATVLVATYPAAAPAGGTALLELGLGSGPFIGIYREVNGGVVSFAGHTVAAEVQLGPEGAPLAGHFALVAVGERASPAHPAVRAVAGAWGRGAPAHIAAPTGGAEATAETSGVDWAEVGLQLSIALAEPPPAGVTRPDPPAEGGPSGSSDAPAGSGGGQATGSEGAAASSRGTPSGGEGVAPASGGTPGGGESAGTERPPASGGGAPGSDVTASGEGGPSVGGSPSSSSGPAPDDGGSSPSSADGGCGGSSASSEDESASGDGCSGDESSSNCAGVDWPIGQRQPHSAGRARRPARGQVGTLAVPLIAVLAMNRVKRPRPRALV